MRGEQRRHRRGDRAAVERRLHRDALLLRQQHQHARGRHAPHGVPGGADAHGQQLRREEQPDQGPEGEHQRRRHPRRPHRGDQREAPAPAVRGPDQDKLGNTEVKGIVEAIVNDKLGAFLEENPAVARRHRDEGGGRGAGARRGPEGARPGAAEGRAGEQQPAGQAGGLPGARPRAERALHRRGRLGRRIGQAGPRPAVPGDPAARRARS